ncbi:MAG: serine/threonine-protein kinase [Pseudomonadota bacterium]
MKPSQDEFARLASLYEELSAAPEGWSVRLEEIARDEPRLAQRLREMLEQTGADPIAHLVESGAAELTDSMADPAIGQLLGPYRILDVLGRGGMGAVYRARREDDEFTMQVAIKRIRLGLDNPATRERFLRERQILANLQHPGLASLLDGGTDEAGAPFVVMEYVAGEPLNVYCRQKNLSVPERLRLFVKLCRTTQFVHSHLIVHRDIKPANVLVDAQGTPRLLDFGIAKLLADDPAADQTATGQRMLTPGYASPEQILGEPVSVASDVYALGAVLFDLLVDAAPFDRLTTRIRLLAEQGTSTTTRPPSRVLLDQNPGAARRARRLRGDLDNIVLKAMRREPQRRYASASALADDVERYLSSRPVLARPDRLSYRVTRFVQRYRFSVAAGVLAVAALIAFSVVTAFQAQRLTQERDRALAAEYRAEIEAATARETADFLTSLFNAANPRQAGNNQFMTARDLLDVGLDRLAGDTIENPEVRMAIYKTIGYAYSGLGEQARAEAALTGAWDTAIATYGPDALETAEYKHRAADAIRANGDPDRAERLQREALETRMALLPMTSYAVADGLNNLALSLVNQGRYEEALAMHEQSISLHQQREGPDHDVLTTPYYNYGLLLRRMGDPAGAEAAALRSQAVNEDDPSIRAKARNLQARVVREQGRLEESLSLYNEVVPRYLALFGEDAVRTLIAQLERADLRLDLGQDNAAGEELSALSERVRKAADERLQNRYDTVLARLTADDKKSR